MGHWAVYFKSIILSGCCSSVNEYGQHSTGWKGKDKQTREKKKNKEKIEKKKRTKVIRRPQLSDFNGRFDFARWSGGRCASGALLQHNGVALDDNEEVVAGFALLHDRLAVLEGARLECVGHGESLPLLQALWNDQNNSIQPPAYKFQW